MLTKKNLEERYEQVLSATENKVKVAKSVFKVVSKWCESTLKPFVDAQGGTVIIDAYGVDIGQRTGPEYDLMHRIIIRLEFNHMNGTVLLGLERLPLDAEVITTALADAYIKYSVG